MHWPDCPGARRCARRVRGSGCRNSGRGGPWPGAMKIAASVAAMRFLVFMVVLFGCEARNHFAAYQNITGAFTQTVDARCGGGCIEPLQRDAHVAKLNTGARFRAFYCQDAAPVLIVLHRYAMDTHRYPNAPGCAIIITRSPFSVREKPMRHSLALAGLPTAVAFASTPCLLKQRLCPPTCRGQAQGFRKFGDKRVDDYFSGSRKSSTRRHRPEEAENAYRGVLAPLKPMERNSSTGHALPHREKPTRTFTWGRLPVLLAHRMGKPVTTSTPRKKGSLGAGGSRPRPE